MAQKQLVSFYIDDDLFGMNILLVREIIRNLNITSVDKSPEYVAGLINLRGQIVTVLDLGSRLGLEKREITKSTSCVVLKTNTELERNRYLDDTNESTSPDVVGLLVDKIGDVVDVNTDEIYPPATHASGVASRFIDGVVKLDKTLLVQLKIGEVLNAEDDVVQESRMR